MTTTVLAAGNHFIHPDLFGRAVHEAAGDAPLEVREIRFDWPHTPSARSPRSSRPPAARTR